jgi:glycerate kinase
MLSLKVVQLALIVTVMFGEGLLDQSAAAGKLITGSHPTAREFPVAGLVRGTFH